MDKMLVVVFDSEKRAYQARRDLQELHREGSITLYADAIIAKDGDGVVHVRQAADEGPIGTFVGMMVGTLVGALAGPAGMAIGMAGGTTVGAIRDAYVWGVDAEYVDDVGASLDPGKAAVVAELTEFWSWPLDVKMEDGIIIRQVRADVAAEQSEREVQALKADYEALKAEVKQSHEENKIALMQRMEKAKQALSGAADRAESRRKTFKSNTKAKVAALKAQAKKSHGDAKARYRASIEEIEQDYKVRSAKLKAANRLARDALKPSPSAAQHDATQHAQA